MEFSMSDDSENSEYDHGYQVILIYLCHSLK